MPSPRPLTAAIVGLGNIGFAFNADRKRRGVWSHERALSRSGTARLVGAADPSLQARRRFAAARPDVPVYSDYRRMLRELRPELVSVCTPTALHARVVRAAAASGARAIFDEKPLAATAREGAALLALCRRRGVTLAVNHTRRWDGEFLRAAAVVRNGGIGELRSASGRYSGRVYNVGTHLFDALRMLTGRAPRRAWGTSPDPAAADPDVSGLLELDGGVMFALACHGRPADLLFELDLVGTEGRLRVLENGLKTVHELFAPSPRYGGYREPRPAPLARTSRADRFLSAVRDVCACARTGRRPACSGADGYYALAAAQALRDSSRRGGAATRIPPLPKPLEAA